MFTKIFTFLKPTENFRITSVDSKNIAAQIGNVFYAITEDNPSYSLKFTVSESTDHVVKAQYTNRISEYFYNQKIDEYDKLGIRYFDRKAFDNQIAQLS